MNELFRNTRNQHPIALKIKARIIAVLTPHFAITRVDGMLKNIIIMRKAEENHENSVVERP